ncbi:Histidine kinase [Rhodovastum atsumiense]|uniref:histidine kinase n=1 Tax=Rhodovastum atsumiense TaxID=504468 RepID=A0A5M6J1H3_9PROT|nr:PAS domain S-box protein [Rhodovastum atsumiense]KAA5613917.1 PAS domain S-box protein [Rhodovastum atsumiense]CAH2602049.1 Histidine kinase [Rhodovastum atsumiense]
MPDRQKPRDTVLPAPSRATGLLRHSQARRAVAPILAATCLVAVAAAGTPAWVMPAAAGAVALAGIAVARSLALAAATREAGVAAERQCLLDMMDMAAILVRDTDGTIRFWSEGCRRLYGWTAGQAIGQSSHTLLQTIFSAPLADIETALLRDGTWAGDLRQRTQAGTEVIVSARKVLRHCTGGRVAVMENLTDVTGLRQAEADLKRSEAQLHSIVDSAAEGIIVAGTDGHIASVNPAALCMFGYDRAEELIGRDIGALMPTADAANHRRRLAEYQGSGPRVVSTPGRELAAIRRDGSAFPIDLSVSTFTNGRRYVTGIIRDATARKQAETELRNAEARLRLVQQVGGIAYTDRTLPDDAAMVSDDYAHLYGLPPDRTHITIDAWRELVHPADRDAAFARIDDVMRQGGPLALEFRIRRPDGTVHWIAMRLEVFLGADGRPQRVISAHQDITEIMQSREAEASRAAELERRVAERTAALGAAEARFRGIFDSQFQYIGLLAPDGTTLEVNHTALQATGRTREQILGRPFAETEWWPADERERLRTDIAEAAQGLLIRREVRNHVAGGRDIWIDFSLTPVQAPGTQDVTWIIAEGRDLTEKRALADRLAQAQKVQALGQLASGIAHDFNNILQAVTGAATLIERRPDQPDKTRHLARTAIEAAGRGASITQRLLSFARQSEPRTEVLATAGVLENIREVLAHTLGSTIQVRDIVATDTPPVLADRGQLETALVNLGTNARDAMPEGGTLTLAAVAEQVGGDGPHPSGLAAGEYVRLDVSDTGTGMDRAILAQASEPFFTTKPPGQGTGLGLPMVRAFAEQSGGAMAIASLPEAGTTVTLWLPRASTVVPTPEDSEDGHMLTGAPARLLLVDDDDLVREMLAAQLEDLGFATLVAGSGAEAVALLEAGEEVDAMVSDLSMPAMNGVTLIRQAHALRPQLPCFLLTGYVGERAALGAADSFTLVRKPVRVQTLAARIEAGLEAARISRTPGPGDGA